FGARTLHPQILGAQLERLTVVERNRQGLAVLVQPQPRRPRSRRLVLHSPSPRESSRQTLAQFECTHLPPHQAWLQGDSFGVAIGACTLRNWTWRDQMR